MNSRYRLFPDDGFVLTYEFCFAMSNFSTYKSLRLLEILGSEGIFLFANKNFKKKIEYVF